MRTLFQEVRDLNHGGMTSLHKDFRDIPGAVAAAQKADYVVLTLSNFGNVGSEGIDVESIEIDSSQQQLIKAIGKVGKPTVMVVIDAGAVALDDIVDFVPAILQAHSPGAHGAIAIAETVFGDNNPGGKLPVTMYRSSYVKEVDFLDMSMTAGAGRK